MNKLFSVVMLFAVLGSAQANDGQEVAPKVQINKLDNMQACYLKNDVYSEGMKVKTETGEFLCQRKMAGAYPSDDLPLQWVSQ